MEIILPNQNNNPNKAKKICPKCGGLKQRIDPLNFLLICEMCDFSAEQEDKCWYEATPLLGANGKLIK